MDEAQDTEKILAEQMRDLPQALRDAITSPEVEEKLRILTQRHHLHIDQSATLENEVVLGLMGFTSLYTFADTLVEELGLSREAAIALAEDLSREVFEPVHDQLRRATEGDPEDTIERASVPFEDTLEDASEEGSAETPPPPSLTADRALPQVPTPLQDDAPKTTPQKEIPPPPPKLTVDLYRESL